MDVSDSGECVRMIPLSFHCLPVSVMLDLVIAYEAKHVLDLTPTPMQLDGELAKRGISYFALCGTEVQKEFLESKLHTSLIAELLDSNSPLGDARFIQEVDAAGACCQEMVPEPAGVPKPPKPAGRPWLMTSRGSLCC